MAERYPAATWLGNGKSGGSYTGGPWRLVIHTTETRGVPGYNSGSSAPHVTIDNDGRVYQHTSFLTAARALRNEAGGVQTNREQAIQVEIVCYSQKSLADKLDKGVWVGNLPDVQWRAVVDFVQWVVEEFGVLPVVPERQAFDYAQANAPGFRMSNAEWDGFDAICGHQHVPENCVSADTPILCADLNWRPAGDLQPGDELVAFDEESPDQAGRRLRRSTVTNNDVVRDALLMVNTPAGSIRCNCDHPWLVRRGDRNKWGSWQWLPARDLQPGDEVMHVLDVWQPDRSHEAGWLAGMFDADGWLSVSSKGTYFGLSQRMELSSLIDDAELAMKEAGVECARSVTSQRSLGNSEMARLSVQSRAGILRALGVFRPKRLLADSAKAWEGGSLGKLARRVPVTSVEPWGTGSIASLETSTSTYIAGGFAMHNSHWDPGAFPWDQLAKEINPTKEIEVFLPISQKHVGERQSDIGCVARLINVAFGTNIPEDGTWGDEMVDAINDNLPGTDGKYMNGKQYANLLVAVGQTGGTPQPVPGIQYGDTVKIVKG